MKEQTMTEHYHEILIGTGGTLAYKLAGSGKRILLLERGDFVPREKENWDATIGRISFSQVNIFSGRQH